jgi:hypothetical protein
MIAAIGILTPLPFPEPESVPGPLEVDVDGLDEGKTYVCQSRRRLVPGAANHLHYVDRFKEDII